MVILKTKNLGFTLIECLIALLLLTIILVGGMAFYFYSNDYFQAATHKRIATEIANTKLEEIKNGGYAALPSTDGQWGSDESVTVDVLTVKQQIYVTSRGSYKQVEVRVSWQDAIKSGEQEIRLDTYMAPNG